MSAKWIDLPQNCDPSLAWVRVETKEVDTKSMNFCDKIKFCMRTSKMLSKLRKSFVLVLIAWVSATRQLSIGTSKREHPNYVPSTWD